MAEQRYQAVLAVITRRPDRCARWPNDHGVSRQSVYMRWIANYEAAGLAATGRPFSSAGESCPHQIAAEPWRFRPYTGAAQRMHPTWGQRRIHHELAEARSTTMPSESAIYRALTRNGLLDPGHTAPQEEQLHTVGERGPADGAVADGRHGRGASRRWLREPRCSPASMTTHGSVWPPGLMTRGRTPPVSHESSPSPFAPLWRAR